MTSQYRLVGGARDSEVTDEVPVDYWLVNVEAYERPVPGQPGLVIDDTRLVARWRGDDLVYLTTDADHDDGELVRREDLPGDAIQTALRIDGEDIEGADPGKYDVFQVER